MTPNQTCEAPSVTCATTGRMRSAVGCRMGPLLRWFASFLCALAPIGGAFADADEIDVSIRKQLYAVNQLRAGKHTPFDQVESETERLLALYGDTPEVRAAIYYTAAGVYAQTGMLFPQKTIDYCKKSIESIPTDRMADVQMYVYWGDAIQIANAGVTGAALAQARREAVIPYLRGLRVLVALGSNEPEPAPPPRVIKPGRGTSDPQKIGLYLDYMAKLESIRVHRRIVSMEDVTTRQIAFMYSRLPFATDELRKLAMDIIESEDAVDRLIAAVEVKVRERTRKLEVDAGLYELPPDIDKVYDPNATTAPAPGDPPGGNRAMPKPASVNQAGAHTNTGKPVSVYVYFVLGALAVCGIVTSIILVRKRASAR